jgi:hypothetical protein
MVKTVPCDSIGKFPPEWTRDREGGSEAGMEGKLNGNHLRLIPGLYLEDRTN